MKPNIQLVGGCASSFVNEAADTQLPESGNDRSKPAAAKNSEAGMLLDEFLATILKSVAASAGIVRVLSPDGRQFRSIAASGMLPDICQGGSAVDAGCGICGKAADTQTVETSDAQFCMSLDGCRTQGHTAGIIVFDNGDGDVVVFFCGSSSVITMVCSK